MLEFETVLTVAILLGDTCNESLVSQLYSFGFPLPLVPPTGNKKNMALETVALYSG